MRIPRRTIAGVAVLAVAGVGYAGYAAAADDPSYRTTRATIGDLQETVDLTGTVEPAGRADLAFATSGGVAKIGVEPGEKVKAGQTLGRLDDGSLREAVQRARSTLASARAQLESDLAAQTEAVTDSGSEGTQTPQSGGQSPQGGGQSPSKGASPDPDDHEPDGEPDGGVDPKALAAQQQAVLTAQSAVSTSLAAAHAALAAQQAVCTTTPEAAVSQECADALTAVQTAQQQVSTDQQALQDALDALGTTLTAADAAADAVAATTTTGPAIVLVAATTGTDGNEMGGGGGTVTAATLAKDQASIDQARADLVAAQQELAMASVTAPFAGRIVAVDAAVGDSVAAGTEVFVLVSQGTTTVQVSVSSTQVQELKVGQVARATPAGADTALKGAVTQVSTVPDSDSTYAVTITLRRKHLDIATGLTASVAVVTGTASDVVTVPASAVSDGRVTVLDDGTATPTPVTTGVVGSTRVEITDGLAKGDEVVLADLDEPVPTGDTETDTRMRFGGPGGGGGFGGTGGPPAGFQRQGR